MFVACCSLHSPCCSLFSPCFSLLYGCCSLASARCSLLFARCLSLSASCLWLYARCPLYFARNSFYLLGTSYFFCYIILLYGCLHFSHILLTSKVDDHAPEILYYALFHKMMCDFHQGNAYSKLVIM